MKLDKMTVSEIEDWLLTSSPIFGMPNFKDILRIHVTESYYKVMSKILQDSLKELDRKNPVMMSSIIYVKPSTASYTFVDNFDMYLNNEIPERYVTLLPTSIVNIGGSMLYGARTWQLQGNDLMYLTATGNIECQYLARHPYRFSKHPTEDEFTEESAIYGISYMRDYHSDMFLNILTYHLICYIIELKTQVNYTELPIEIFSGLVEKKSDLDNILNEYFLSPTQYSYLWR